MLHFVRKPCDKYVARDRLTRDGDGREVEAAAGVPPMHFDGVGCVLKGKVLVAVSFKPESLGEDRERAKVLVNPARTLNCEKPSLVIDQAPPVAALSNA